MKGVELLAELVSLLVMIGVTIVLGGVMIMSLNLVQAASPFAEWIGRPIEKEWVMVLSPLYQPIQYEDMVLSYLESTDDSGLQIKKIIAYAAYQENVTNVFIDGKEIDLVDSSSKIFSQWFEESGYILVLNIDGHPYVLAQNRRAFPIFSDRSLRLRRISQPTYVDKESVGVTDKTHELPLDATLDLYVL